MENQLLFYIYISESVLDDKFYVENADIAYITFNLNEFLYCCP